MRDRARACQCDVHMCKPDVTALGRPTRDDQWMERKLSYQLTQMTGEVQGRVNSLFRYTAADPDPCELAIANLLAQPQRYTPDRRQRGIRPPRRACDSGNLGPSLCLRSVTLIIRARSTVYFYARARYRHGVVWTAEYWVRNRQLKSTPWAHITR